ncbi:MAG: hypothetical protein H0W83_04235 [Planctomycetes bacterium]|nr:hypothetical protein [Planctomycetota bacterium]
MRYRLDDQVLAALQPTLKSTEIATLTRDDLRRRDQLREMRAMNRAASLKPTDRIEKATERIEKERSTERIAKVAVPTAKAPETKKPTDSFTLNPSIARRALDSVPATIIDADTEEILAEVRAVPFRNEFEVVIKVQCYLPVGQFLKRDGRRVDVRIDGARYRIKDGFYVKPRQGEEGEWSYLGYVG